MSSIERAMAKIGGHPKDGDAGPENEAEPATAAAAEAETAEVVEAPPGTIQRDEQQVEAAPVPPAASDGRTREPEPGPLSTAPDHEPSSGKAPVHIDFERLAASGHLVPGATNSHLAEEFQQVKRRLLGNAVPGILPHEKAANLIMITSAVPGEGKTFVSVNLCLSLSMEYDHTVLAIDTDISRKGMSRSFGVADRKGLYDHLGDDSIELEDLLVRTSIPNLVVLPAGQNTTAPTERLASVQMRKLAEEFSTRYADRVVIFDTPPVLATTNAAALAPYVGQLVLVVEAARTKQETVNHALQRLDGLTITGVILNKARRYQTSGYEYYGYYYGDT